MELINEKNIEDEIIPFKPISINKNDFDNAYQNLLNFIENKQSIRTILNRKDYAVHENIWKQVVFNDFEKQSLENYKEEILTHVRNLLNNPTIQLDIIIDPSKAQVFLNSPNQTEQKIQKFFQENPDLKTLFEIFDLLPINFTEIKENQKNE